MCTRYGAQTNRNKFEPRAICVHSLVHSYIQRAHKPYSIPDISISISLNSIQRLYIVPFGNVATMSYQLLFKIFHRFFISAVCYAHITCSSHINLNLTKMEWEKNRSPFSNLSSLFSLTNEWRYVLLLVLSLFVRTQHYFKIISMWLVHFKIECV